MRVFLKSNGMEGRAWSLLIPDSDLPTVPFDFIQYSGGQHAAYFDAVSQQVRRVKLNEAVRELSQLPISEWLTEQGPAGMRQTRTSFRVPRSRFAVRGPAERNGLMAWEWLFGLSFRFPERKQANHFRLSWSGGRDGLLDYQT